MKKIYKIAFVLMISVGFSSLNAGNKTVVDLTSKNFQQIMSGKKPVFVKFWAAWCGPCRRMTPKYKKVSKDYLGKILFAELNVDKEKAIARKYGIRSIPTTILFIDGVEADRVKGGLDTEYIKYWADEIIRGRYR